MSIVVIPGAVEPTLTDADYAGLLAAVGVHDAPQQDQDDYRAVLKSFLAVMAKVDDGPDYTPPSLMPQPADRAFSVPLVEENPFNAWSHRCAIAAPTTAASNVRLQGRSLAVKDNIAVAGLPTTIGTSPFLFADDGRWDLAPVDATAVVRLLAAGVVVRGTSTCEAWCASPLSYTSYSGPVHNPRLHGHTAGGSSSGSAALVAAHSLLGDATATTTVPLAIGTDQAGSVRIPASYNGIYGLKPTFGLVPYTGAASMSPMIDHLGPLAGSLEDIAALLQVMAGYDGLDPRMTPESPLREHVKPYGDLLAAFRTSTAAVPAKPLRVGILRQGFEVPGLTDAVRDTVLKAARSSFAAAGAEVVDVSVPMHADGAVIWNAATRPSMATWLLQGRCSGHLSYLSPHIHPTPARWPADQATYDHLHANNPAAVNILLSQAASQRLLPPGLEAKAHRLVFALRAAYDDALATVDVLVTPCAPDVAKPLPLDLAHMSVRDKMAYAVGTTNNTSPFNVTGHPALNVPCGFAAHAARPDVPLPVGMQLVGRRFEDDQLILAAALFERGRAKLGTTCD
ncbi:amidase [Grosmannia clavigera kw1407]|uniref:Amidase n=1 Tax=Grosmannia clavigera (strain kw1407 / UAMH 11150) TaxID=655863 RepID=F0XMT6_GROCL|nr:amidase [Grosmannia clavigera kw1407]EFX01254.1 amidase [Grosmannia clavigera kw1407]